MKEQSNYYYQKRIKELEAELSRLRPYRRVMLDIYWSIANLKNGNYYEPQWYLRQMRELFK